MSKHLTISQALGEAGRSEVIEPRTTVNEVIA